MIKKITALFLVIVILNSISIADDQKTKNKSPNFTLPDIKGKNYTLFENLGEGPVVINFWATWCIPCLEELKKMKKIYKKYSDDVQFLAISIDDPKTVGRVKKFVKSHRFPYRILLDTNNEVIRLLQGSVPPYTLILDKSGQVVYSHVGYRSGDEKKIAAKLENLLK